MKNIPGDVRFWYVIPAKSPEDFFSPDVVVKVLNMLGLPKMADEYMAVVGN